MFSQKSHPRSRYDHICLHIVFCNVPPVVVVVVVVIDGKNHFKNKVHDWEDESITN